MKSVICSYLELGVGVMVLRFFIKYCIL